MKRKNNPLVDLRKSLNEQKDLGIFDNPSEELIEQVNHKIDLKVKEYFNDLFNRDSKYFISKLKSTFNKYKKNISKRHSIKSYRLNDLNPVLYERFKIQRVLSLSLIKSQNKENMNKLKKRFLDWVTLKEAGSDKETLYEMTKLPKDKWTKFILKDQTSKMINSFDREVSEFYGGAIAFQWKVNEDNRVVGKPGGVNQKVTNPKMHGNHWKRKNKFYYNPEKKKELISNGVDLGKFEGDYNSIPDGMPGIPIGCRCWAYYIYDIDDLPKNMLKYS